MSRRLFKKRFLKRIISKGKVSREIAICEFEAVIEDIEYMGFYVEPEAYADECMYAWVD